MQGNIDIDVLQIVHAGPTHADVVGLGLISEITMLDAFYAIEGHGHFYALSHFAQKIFHRGDRVLQSENEIMDVFAHAENLFLKELSGYPLSNFLEGIDYSNGTVDWAALGLGDPKCAALKGVASEER
jgi:hypothetical protein